MKSFLPWCSWYQRRYLHRGRLTERGAQTSWAYKATDSGLSMSDQAGDSYTAKFDGLTMQKLAQVERLPLQGRSWNPERVSLKKDRCKYHRGNRQARNRRVITVIRMTVAPDGKTLSANVDDKLGGRAYKWTSEKQ